ncbi:hypothetical protein DPMN_064602 [Dreissena polymorpha]|uniref:Uncharacterized protein n=1 Tax=Dreissena polymorpha TaxID=45954 RepID=A0A9D4HJL1_DREPO|nr:hypothetical protein DPMN_064602 [Dreissena polymorpha]
MNNRAILEGATSLTRPSIAFSNAAPKSSIGYGFCVFTLEALTVVEKNIQDTFSENGNHPLVKLVANEKLKSAYKKNKRLVSSYTESVLVKEACSVIMQEVKKKFNMADNTVRSEDV